jgi:hypothetical protein
MPFKNEDNPRKSKVKGELATRRDAFPSHVHQSGGANHEEDDFEIRCERDFQLSSVESPDGSRRSHRISRVLGITPQKKKMREIRKI